MKLGIVNKTTDSIWPNEVTEIWIVSYNSIEALGGWNLPSAIMAINCVQTQEVNKIRQIKIWSAGQSNSFAGNCQSKSKYNIRTWIFSILIDHYSDWVIFEYVFRIINNNWHCSMNFHFQCSVCLLSRARLRVKLRRTEYMIKYMKMSVVIPSRSFAASIGTVRHQINRRVPNAGMPVFSLLLLLFVLELWVEIAERSSIFRFLYFLFWRKFSLDFNCLFIWNWNVLNIFQKIQFMVIVIIVHIFCLKWNRSFSYDAWTMNDVILLLFYDFHSIWFVHTYLPSVMMRIIWWHRQSKWTMLLTSLFDGIKN